MSVLRPPGSQPALDACFAHVTPGSVIIQTALGTRPVQIDASTRLTLRDVTYKRVYCYPVTNWPRVIGLSASGAIPAEQIVTAVDSLHELSAGFEELLDPTADALKIIISV
jgi:(R,R)-butanediol dehydrogenase/meso-butanediol dehydrogenase/diacetyl reductase